MIILGILSSTKPVSFLPLSACAQSRRLRVGKRGGRRDFASTGEGGKAMNAKNITMGMMGVAAVGAAAMLMRPKKNRRVKKALKTVSEAVNTISNMLG